MPGHIDPVAALSMISRLVSFAVLISSLELFYLAGKGEFSPGGAWDWSVLKSVSMPRSQYIDPLMKGSHSFLVLLLLRVVAAFLLTSVGMRNVCTPEILSVLVVCQILLNNRLLWGDDGSDQMVSLTFV